jgi:hypothetical protein
MIVETSSARVLGEGEQRIAGWTLLSPEDRNIKISPKLEEKVLLLVSPPPELRVLAHVAEQSCHLRGLVQLHPRKGRWIHPDTIAFHHVYSERSIHSLTTTRSRSRSYGGESVSQGSKEVTDFRTRASSSISHLKTSRLDIVRTRFETRGPNHPSLPLHPVLHFHRSSMPI